MGTELIGFYVIWHLEGGFEGLQRLGMSRSAIYRRIAIFRRMTGEHPDTFAMAGLTFDLDAYVAAVQGFQAKHKAGARRVPG
jgi:hypothetical protein